MTRLPPAVVLGIDSPIGLAVVRELGGRGVPVHGIARARRGLGLHSKWLHRGYVRPAPDSALIDLIETIARDSGAAFLMTISMNDALAMRAAADAGRLHNLRPLIPTREKLELVNDKLAICAIAREIGIETPWTWEPHIDDLDKEFPGDLTYPCVLKWRDPERAAIALTPRGISILKTEYARDLNELRYRLNRYRSVGRFPMVQSFCPGQGLGQMFLMKDGNAKLRFQHRRLHEWPPAGGTSTLCESVGLSEHAHAMGNSEELLRRIAWEGPAMVEYRHDPRTGRMALMEINGRFWGSLPLAYHAGAPFAWATYCALGLQLEMDTVQYRAGLRCRYMVPETRRLYAILSRNTEVWDQNGRGSRFGEILTYVGDFLRTSMRYYVFSFADIKPFIVDTLSVLSKGVSVGVAGVWRGLSVRNSSAPAG